MLTTKKRLWIEISLHIVFWVGVFYTLMSLNSSHIHVRLKTRDAITDQYEDSNISSYVYLIFGFLLALFYGNIFWIFRKALKYKNSLVRLAICGGWFVLIFGANYFIAGPLFDHTNHAIEPPHMLTSFQKDTIGSASRSPGHSALPHIDKDIIIRLPQHIVPDHRVFQHINVVNFMISDWAHMQVIILLVFLAILCISVAYFFLKEWSKSELIQTQLQANQLSTEIKFLKSQVNPHFLFNTLNNLFSMAQGKGNDELADGISKLSGMMRYMIYESNEESVPLAKEIEYLQDCIVLNKLRYADSEVRVIFDHPDKTEGVTIAPMLFIPFVENAFKHGVSIGTSSQIDIAISLNKEKLIFTCENTSYSFIKKMEDEKSGIGLENVRRRLQLVYPGKHKLMIDDSDGEYIVKLEIDLG